MTREEQEAAMQAAGALAYAIFISAMACLILAWGFR
jgi:hypothetical protein